MYGDFPSNQELGTLIVAVIRREKHRGLIPSLFGELVASGAYNVTVNNRGEYPVTFERGGSGTNSGRAFDPFGVAGGFSGGEKIFVRLNAQGRLIIDEELRT